MSGLQTPQELEENLRQYREQLAQVEQLLMMGSDEEMPGQDLQDMYQSLTEASYGVATSSAATLTVAAGHAFAKAVGTNADVVLALAAAADGDAAGPVAKIVTPPELNLPAILPASVAEQIRKAQIRAALTGQAPGEWAIGAQCQAVYSADGEYYDATVEAVSEAGNFIVVFDGYGNKEEVGLTGVRPRPSADEGYRGVAAPKRKRVEEEPVVTEIPKWLAIKETDDEKTKARKKKLLKSFKSKIRFQNMDLAQKQKQDTWQSFLKGKGSKKKTGFLTGE
ncbi:hypothetical protein VOLCADRAFT_103530 [Volvox carteri f. nagariensis]|uniref:Survival of motor neuron-related-splicing factor 30 n=1 Tax=Volvox carteri f. nagariensis TaxID=3068 RepID=D8TMH7_VOLCA|nr:uncharacterized protein VOLCADRAFT_103530 [Volvox carteri f. nagariensis]EFJ51259.1 hypothetical protein VOLCADRAFT_103530 [Volvox carteri f. nagariensis]|eukprot:XP_002947726.1 hypothetical protein VOLCADRAFT_103530 [Volvox carteri f. nagariensis]